jgi:hypothetical protein
MMRITTIIRRTVIALAISAAGLGAPAAAIASAATASASTAAGDGWIRLTHLSPNTPAVDVYLYSFGDPSAMIVLKHVSYGTVSPYERVTAGAYSVAMRATGAAASSPAVLSTSVQIDPGHAYTVAGLGPESGLRLAVLDDRLTTAAGTSVVRVIQASLKQHLVDVAFGGTTLARNLAFGSVSSYRTVSSGAGTVTVSAGGDDASQKVSLAADSVHTLVVLDGASGLEIVNLLDAAGNIAVPVGAVKTGFGGTAPHGPPSPVPWLAVIAAGTALAAAAGLRLRLRRLRPLPRLRT